MKHFVAVKHTRKELVSRGGYNRPAEYRDEMWQNAYICKVGEDGTFEMPSVNAAYPLRGKLEPARLKLVFPDSGYVYVPLLRDAEGTLRSVWPVLDYEFVIKEDVS